MEKEKNILINYIISYVIWNIVLSLLLGSIFTGVIEMINNTILIEKFGYTLALIITALLSIISNSILTLINNAIASHSAFRKVTTISREHIKDLIINILQFYIFANLILTIISYFIHDNFTIINLIITIIQLFIGALLINGVLKNYMNKFISN